MQNVLDILLLLAPVLLALVVAVVGTAAAEPTDGVVDVHHQHPAYFFGLLTPLGPSASSRLFPIRFRFLQHLLLRLLLHSRRFLL
jgi:hypothetical protein